jgi:hypothetical protein
MPNKVRTARGELIDFDLLRIKQQIAKKPPETEVKTRENFIDKKFQRRLKKINPEKIMVELPDVSVEPTVLETNDTVSEPTVEEKPTKPKKHKEN